MKISNTSGKDGSHVAPNDDSPSKQAPFLRQVVVVSLACWVDIASGVSLGYATPALPSVQSSDSPVRLTEAEGSWMASLMMLGALCGGALAGPCISVGRLRALWLLAVPLTAAWALLVWASTPGHVLVAHALMGAVLGVASDSSQIYVSEAASAERRGALGVVPYVLFSVGMLLSYVAGAWLSWQPLAMFGLALTLPALVLPALLPESPGFLVAQGRCKEAREALLRLRGARYDVDAELEVLMHCEKGSPLLARLRKLCDKDLRKPLILPAVVRMLSRFCGLRAIQCYTHSIFMGSGSSVDANMSMIATGVVPLTTAFVAFAILDRFGRRFLLISSQLVMGLSLSGLGLYFYYHKELETSPALGWVPLAAMLLYLVANSLGLAPVSGIMIGELVPQRHRSVVSSATGALSWLSAFVVTKTFLDLQDAMSLHGAFWAYAAVCFIGVPVVYFFIPETRGLSAYEIEILFDDDTKKKLGDIETATVEIAVIHVPPEKQQTGHANA